MFISSIDEARYVMNLSQAVTFDRLSQHIRNAEISYVLPLLGTETYDELSAYHADASKFKIQNPDFAFSPGTQEQGVTDSDYMHAVLLWYTQHAILNIAYNIGFEVLNAFISDGGFKRQESETTKTLFKYQEDNLKRYFMRTGMDSLDMMLGILEKNIEHFQSFKPYLQNLKGRIFPATAEFHQHYNIRGSRIVFLRLKQYIRKVEEIDMEQAIGRDNMKEILEALAQETPDEKYTKLLPYLRPPIAYLATAHLMEDTGAEIEERGLYFTGMRSIAESGLELPTDENRVLELVQRNRNIAADYIARLLRYMGKEGWDVNNERPGVIRRDNQGKKTFWA